MADLTTVGILGLAAALIVLFVYLVDAGIIPIGKTEKGVFRAKSPNTWLLSTEYGWDTIREIDQSTDKDLFYLSHLDSPIEDVKIGKNAWILHSIGGLAGGKNVVIHLHDKYINSTLRHTLSQGTHAEQIEMMNRILAENRRLKRENTELRSDAKSYLADVTDTIKTMKKNTDPSVFPQMNRGRGQQQASPQMED